MNILHTYLMRKVAAVAIATSAIYAALPLASALAADVTPSPSPTTSLSPLEQFRIDRDNYFNKMREITTLFKSACDKANSDYASAIASATTKDQKRAARIARESAIAAAAIAFESAKTALGPEPREPMRMAKPQGKSKERMR